MKITAAQFHEKFLNEAHSIFNRVVIGEDGSIYSNGIFISMYDSNTICERAYILAIGYSICHDEAYAAKVRAMLDYARRLLVETNGIPHFSKETVSLCDQGRQFKVLLHAAQLVGDTEAYKWISDLLAAWPYDEKKHRFVERFVAGAGYPTHINGSLDVYNMLAEGAADAWCAGHLAGNRALVEQAKDSVVNFLLPGQREDFGWSYHCKRDVDVGAMSDGEDEYNYNLYLLYVLSPLLEIEEARELVAEPLMRSFDMLYDRFKLGDGSMYAPVHWGWDHLWECTLYAAVLGWRFYHYCGVEKYSEISARALDWLIRADMGVGNLHSSNMTTCGLFWGTYFLDMFKDNFEVEFEGEPATDEQIIATLDRTEKILRIPPADDTHLNFYFSIYGCNTAPAIRRKINRMKFHPEHEIAEIPHEGSVTLSLPWDDPVNCAAGSAEISYDAEGLNLTVDCERVMTNQPYHGPTLFRGDNILLELKEGSTRTLISLTIEEGKPVIYRYNNRFRIGEDLRIFKYDIPRGWYDEKSTLTAEIADGHTRFTARLVKEELGGITLTEGSTLTVGLAIVCHTAYGCQFNQWGKTPLETRPLPYDGKWILK